MNNTMIAWGVASLLLSPAAPAQVLKGSAVAGDVSQGNGPAAQFHARLRDSLQGRTSAKIVNPQAPNFDNSAIIVVCRNQKQNADREAQQFFGDGSVKPAGALGDGSRKAGITDGTSQAVKTGGPSGNLPAVMKANTKGATGPGGGPGITGPMKTESANGNQSPGSGATTTLNSSSAKSAVTGATASHAICPATIGTISGLPTVVFAPGPLFNPYTIKGCGFGNAPGNVYLTGPFYGGKVQLNVQTTGGNRQHPARASWSDTAIVVTVDPNVTGELDQENVTLVIEPASGSPIQKSGNQFLAARQDVPLQTIPKSAVQFFNGISTSLGGKKTGSLTTSDSTSTLAVNTPDLLYFTPSQNPAGLSAEVFRGGTTSFFSAGSDLFDMSGLARGFMAESFQLFQEADPTGCDNGTGKTEGNWNATWSATNIRVSWKEFQCHWPWMGNGPDVWSDYSLSVTVKGPRGIDPWTGRRPLSVVPTRTLAH